MDSIKKLEAWFAECPGALIAFSGGVDSSLVAYLAQRFLGNEQSLAVISASPSLKLSDLESAKDFAQSHGLPLRVIATQEMDNPNYFNNPTNRCYFCKHTLYDDIAELKQDYSGWWVLNGTNADDLGDYRPGLKAASEFSVRSPLSECEINKSEVRALAAEFSLQCWDKPASPCLSSRVPYGELITVAKLRQIESAESVLLEAGFPVNRVRHYGDLARVEVPASEVERLSDFAEVIQEQLLKLGFSRVEFDQEGLVSGKLNRALSTSAEK